MDRANKDFISSDNERRKGKLYVVRQDESNEVNTRSGRGRSRGGTGIRNRYSRKVISETSGSGESGASGGTVSANDTSKVIKNSVINIKQRENTKSPSKLNKVKTFTPTKIITRTILTNSVPPLPPPLPTVLKPLTSLDINKKNESNPNHRPFKEKSMPPKYYKKHETSQIQDTNKYKVVNKNKSETYKSLKKKEKKKNSLPRSKLIIRHIPIDVTEKLFLDIIKEKGYNNKYLFLFVKGKKRNNNRLPYLGQAYLDFKDSIDEASKFCLDFKNYIFPTSDNSEENVLKLQIGYAPNQKMPTLKKKKDIKSGTIDKDPDYIKFLKSINMEAQSEMNKENNVNDDIKNVDTKTDDQKKS